MVNNSDTKVSYQGNGQTTVFPFSFPFIQRDYIKVAIYDSLTDETKTIDSDYYVDTVANTVIYPGYEPGQEPAEALRPPILPATSTITIYRQTDVDQLTDLGEKYPLKDIENMADKLTEIIQEQAETLGRAVKVPVGDPKTPEEKLTDLQNYVSDAANSAKNAADSEASAQRAAEAAATSEANAAESERLASGYADTATDAASRAEDSAISARAYNAPDYDNATTYQAGDVVTFTDGNSYRALQETTGNEPPNIIYWQRVTDYVGDDFFEVDEYGYIVPMDSPSHSRYWRVDQNGYIVPIEGGDGGYRPDTRSLSSEYLNVTNEGYIKHLRADDISAQEVDADEVTAEVAAFNALTANAVNAQSASVTEISAGTVTADDIIAKGPVVDVRAFGAVGDGVHDDTQAIQAAINTKIPVYFPPGKYLISDTLDIYGFNTNELQAGYKGSVFNAENAALIYTGTGNAIRIRGVRNYTISIGNIYAESGSGVYLYANDSSTAIQYLNININYIRAQDDCIKAETADSGWINEVRVNNCRFGNGTNGTHIISASSNIVDGWTFTNVGVEGVTNGFLLDGSTTEIAMILIKGCRYNESFTKLIKSIGTVQYITMIASRPIEESFLEMSAQSNYWLLFARSAKWGMAGVFAYIMSGAYYRMPAPRDICELRGGTLIDANADLNAFRSCGTFFCNTDSRASTLINCPSNVSFILHVYLTTGTGFPRQVLQEKETYKTHIRFYNDDTNSWSGWKYYEATTNS